MASDPTLLVRQATVAHLRADTSVTTTAVGTRIYGERSPSELAWPFVRYGVSAFGQVRGVVTLHAFSKAQYTDEVAAIMAAIVASLGDNPLTLDDGRKLDLVYPEEGGSQIIGDPAEADAWHGIVRFEGYIMRECPVA